MHTRYRKWVQQLYKEFEMISFQYKLKLYQPQIEITQAKHYFACWLSAIKMIRIAEHLILNHDWDTVIQVFKHEIAHQIVDASAGYQSETEKDHGPLFRQACARIGVPPGFAKAAADLPGGIADWQSVVTPNSERLLRKVAKLLALAGSGNEHEALLAMERVQAIYEKYQLSRIANNQPGEYIYRIINPKKKRLQHCHYKICSILTEHFFVQIVYAHLYDPQVCESHKTIELFGTPENVVMAEYVYYFLLRQVQALWQTYRRDKNLSVLFKRSYSMGVLQGLDEKLASMKVMRKTDDLPAMKQRNALLKVEFQSLGEFVGHRFPRLRSVGRSRQSVYQDAFHEGITKGQTITIHKPIDQAMGNRGKFLS